MSAHDGPSAEVDIITAASTGSEATAAAGPGSQQDADAGWEAVRLMTAAKILSSASSTDSDDAAYGLDDDSTSLDDSTAASAQLDLTDLGPMAVLDEIQTLAADSLSLAVGILRQNDADEAGVQLSERLRDFLMVLHKRPISTNSTAAASQHSTGAVGEQAGAAAAVDHADDGFWAGQDEWCDVRAALMEVSMKMFNGSCCCAILSVTLIQCKHAIQCCASMALCSMLAQVKLQLCIDAIPPAGAGHTTVSTATAPDADRVQKQLAPCQLTTPCLAMPASSS
jgi:hypothetical protein